MDQIIFEESDHIERFSLRLIKYNAIITMFEDYLMKITLKSS
jgi:hypothetical protein